MKDQPVVAYFSMEIGLEPEMPTYSGGLGVLAGDTIRSAADLKVPLVAVSLLHRSGYFYQRLDSSGWQSEQPVCWVVEDYLRETPARVNVTIEGRIVHLRAWERSVVGCSGATVPVYFLDSDLTENSEWDRTLTHFLYGGDSHYRLCQEVVLGIGGIRMLAALGYDHLVRFHMNEGHAALLALELLEQQARQSGRQSPNQDDVDAVRKKCVFTTHTPVPAGHDKVSLDLVTRVLGDRDAFHMKNVFCCEGTLNMTYLALNLSHFVNGVAKRHGEISQIMFAHYAIDSITNGVHVATWASDSFRSLFDLHIPGWQHDNFSLRYALNIPKQEVWQAHLASKHVLIQYVNRMTNAGMDVDVLTLGFARRAATYKRADLLFDDIERLRSLSANCGAIQIVFAGKSHPSDHEGKLLIQRLHQLQQQVKPEVKMVYLENYDMALGKLITSGVDVWLNTPEPPLEASGTSGMKAAVNGVPSLSILDGWWIEGCIEGVTGWAIGDNARDPNGHTDRTRDAAALYDKLEHAVIPSFYREQESFIDMMRHAIALNGSFFNTQRMMQEYVLKAYFN